MRVARLPDQEASLLIPQTVAPVTVQTAWVGPTGASWPPGTPHRGREGACWSCSAPTL